MMLMLMLIWWKCEFRAWWMHLCEVTVTVTWMDWQTVGNNVKNNLSFIFNKNITITVHLIAVYVLHVCFLHIGLNWFLFCRPVSSCSCFILTCFILKQGISILDNKTCFAYFASIIMHAINQNSGLFLSFLVVPHDFTWYWHWNVSFCTLSHPVNGWHGKLIKPAANNDNISSSGL